ncbi:acyloxyacyl hydrolase [Flavobacterium sp. Arc2]|jgi:hypothetical protein|uniref:acyloxyacyl hydrolase n=1 Tax=Flavobacterium sp. Arc2 TaxID=3046685 RepID=UPI00352E843E
MITNMRFALLLLLIFSAVHAQDVKHSMSLGVYYGFGNDIKNKDYNYSSRYFKLQFCTVIKESEKMKYEFLVQPQVDFAEHQLLNLYYVKVDVPNYQEKRLEYGKLKNIKNYSLNFGLIVSKPLSERLNVFMLASTGPMITDTETERLSKGFAFSSVLCVGFSLKIYNSILEFRPNFGHLSNAGLQPLNNGFNSVNLEFGLKVPF